MARISGTGHMLSHPGSATHCALACPDILLEIIEQVFPPWSSRSDHGMKVKYDHHKTLAGLARSCRAFNGPATKALWSRLESFIPLLNLLSAFDGHGTDPDTPPTYMICGDILPGEFSRFLELGGFLQSISPSECVCRSDAANSDVWHYLARISGGKPLFPSLRELHWAIRQPSSTEILFLLTSSLRRLTICFDTEDSREWELSQTMLFRTIYDVAPLLAHLTLIDTNYTLLSACLANVNVLHGLRVLSLHEDTSVDLDILRKLSTMESLEELSFAIAIDWLPELTDLSGFRALKALEMNVVSGSIEYARSYLTAFSSPGLRQLTLRIETEVLDLDEISATCTLFALRFPSLEDLTWTLLTHQPVPLDVALAPLFPLRLAKLSLEMHGPPAMLPVLDDNVFAALGKAWPGLTTLSIVVPDVRAEATAAQVTSPHTLLALARAFPLLRSLRIPRVQAPRLEDVREFPLLRHGLRTLIVDRPGPDGEYASFALLLDRLFPELDVDVNSVGVDVYSGFAWKRVLGAVQLCRLARGNLASEG